MRLLWLADVLRSTGATVVEWPGWEARGRDLSTVRGVVYHGTVTGPNWAPSSVARLLAEGRSDLAGPLAQVGYDGRNDVWYVVAAGRANHNGYGRWGNDALGIEEFNLNGLGGVYEPYNVEGFARGAGAITKRLKEERLGARVEGHFEQDPGRKSDPVRTDMNDVRRRVESAETQTGDDMPSIEELKREVTDPIVKAITENTTRDIQDKATRLYRINATLKAILKAELADDAKFDAIIAAIEADGPPPVDG